MSLHDAVKKGDLDGLKTLVAAGEDVNARDNSIGRMPLHYAALSNNVAIAEFLLRHGAVVDARSSKNKLTPLHFAAEKDNNEVAILLVKQFNAPVNAPDKNGRTPLHCAALMDSTEVASFLLEEGATLDAADQDGRTPLHLAAKSDQTTVAEILLDRGASVDAVSRLGRTALHLAASSSGPAFVKLLLRRGANPGRLDKEGNSPLRCLVVRAFGNDRVLEDELKTTYLLVSAGATWSRDDERLVRQVAKEMQRERLVSGLLAAIHGWIKQRASGVKSLARLPLDVYKRGGGDVRFYFQSISGIKDEMAAPGSTEVHATEYRKKLCVVGPNKWGKSSFIKTLTTKEASLETEDVRTIGIDIHRWAFDAPRSRELRRFEVSVWDFVGQDEFQSTHNVFFTKGTMYVLCIDLKAYADALEIAKVEDAGARSSQMDAFVEKNIFRWIRRICACEIESEFVLLGTKSDLIGHDMTLIAKIEMDVTERLHRKAKQAEQEVNRAIVALKKDVHNDLDQQDEGAAGNQQRIRMMETLQKKPRFLSDRLMITSSTDLTGLKQVSRTLQQYITESKSSFLMPKTYACVDHVLRDLRLAVSVGSMSSRVSAAFKSIDELTKAISSHVRLSTDEITATLHVLHDLGDILWFDDAEDELADVVFLSPEIVVDFIRQVVNQTRQEDSVLTQRGRLRHEQLAQLDLWSDIYDDRLMLQLKQLLCQFQLVYPAGSGVIKWNSDLIVPMYWKQHSPASSNLSSSDDSFPARVCWEYDFHQQLPDVIFDKLGVQSYSAHYSSDRIFMRDSFETREEGKHLARVVKKQRDTTLDYEDWTILAIEVKATSYDEAWKQLIWYSINLEKLLEAFPGLWVTRYTVPSYTMKCQVEDLLAERAGQRGMGAIDVSRLPARMEWYTKKVWKLEDNGVSRLTVQDDSGSSDQSETDIEARFRTLLENQFQDVYAHIDLSTDKLLKQLAEIGNRRDYPALWTLELQQEKKLLGLTSTYILKLRSHLSGRCFHPPITITAANSFFGKYGVQIKLGLSLFSNMPLGDFANKIIDCITPELDKAVAVHSLVEDFDLDCVGGVDMARDRSLSPDGTIVLLRDLLTLYDESFDPLKMSTISGLECAVIKSTGEHIWAHRTEIQGRIDIVFRHDYVNSGSSVSVILEEPMMEPLPFQPEPEPEVVPVHSVSHGSPSVSKQWTAQSVVVRLMGVQNLPNIRLIGKQSPYCKWRLINMRGENVASGRTAPHSGGGSNPKWSEQTFMVELPHGGLEALQKCTLVARVKAERGWGFSEEISSGSYVLRDLNTSALEAGAWQAHEVALLHKHGELGGMLTFQIRIDAATV
ncbi:hypothetical protein Poli38472_010174 [Pythium oligandrum]|uniref:C2 domain-containing protein n=1 Tax=Pythium oligandrum TaxID=41045 RepID=A0A8K1C8V3_PYTOL|nr:hypothetical protein Poli38472_010174 [Pythium oligandrum]|eukprot:TMW58615.1 hypothetical protein Poli38472_010174 [Pythium oligandrum]